ncbi:hypothetical protein Tco_0963592 [Tanacetum coccineum]
MKKIWVEDCIQTGRLDDIDVDAKNYLAGFSEKRNVVEKVVVVIDVASTILVSTATINDVDITLAQALAELKSAKPRIKVVIQELETKRAEEEEEQDHQQELNKGIIMCIICKTWKDGNQKFEEQVL